MSALVESFNSSAVFFQQHRYRERRFMSRFESFVLRLNIDDEFGSIDGQITHVGSQTTLYFKGLANLEKVVQDQLESNQFASHDGQTNGHTVPPPNLGGTSQLQIYDGDSSLDGPLDP